jgi:beta-N-acetylglucosaminidase
MTEAKFDKPLNEWVEEDVEVPVLTPEFDEKKKTVKIKRENQIFKQKTFYSNAPQRKVICAQGTHKFACTNKGKYIFKCVKCDFHKIAYPVTFKFDPKTGILSYRKTGIRL